MAAIIEELSRVSGESASKMHQRILEDFRKYGHGLQSYDKGRMNVFLRTLGVSEAETSQLLTNFGLIADGDELDFEAFVAFLFDSTDAANANVAHIAPQLAAELGSCTGALDHVMYVQPPGTADAEAGETLHRLIGGSRQSRIGVIGSLSFDRPGIRYSAEGAEGVERIVRTAAQATMRYGKPCRVVCGGSYGGPQQCFAEACEQHASRPLTMVHVVPNCDAALSDLKGIIWDGDKPRRRRCRWKLAFVGSNFSRRNCILAALNGSYVMCAGGPGTHTELCELRYKNAGLLPLVRTGGLCEGVEFKEKSVKGMADALQKIPPRGVAEESWKIMLGEGDPSFEEYCEAIEQVFSALRFISASEPSNVWQMNATERKEWEDFKQNSDEFDKAKS